MSVLLFPIGPLAEPAWLTALGAVAVAEVVSEWTGRDAAIKWPNDVRVGGRKVAGILVERGAGAVVGIGLNANLTPDDFPDDLRDTATSLLALTGVLVDRSELVRDLVRRLDDRYELLEHHGAAVLNASWRDRSEHIGRSVRVSTPSGVILGRLDDLDLTEGVLLTGEDGRSHRVSTRHILSITPPCEDHG